MWMFLVIKTNVEKWVVGEDQLLQMINSVTADDLSHSFIIHQKTPLWGLSGAVYKPAHNESKYACGCSFASTPPNHLLM